MGFQSCLLTLPAYLLHTCRGLRGPFAQGARERRTALPAPVITGDGSAVHAGVNVRALLDNPASTNRHELEQGDALHPLSGILQVACTIATAVVCIVWFYRVRANAEAFARDDIAAAVFGILFVRKLTRMQQVKPGG
ncbi:DUF4328 domain-containing protein [Streptomyces sp. NPDC054765]